MNYSYEKALQAILRGQSYAMQLKLRLGEPMANDGSISSYDLATSLVDCFSNAIINLSEFRKSTDDYDQCHELSSKDSHPQMNHSNKRKTSSTSSSENWRDDSPSPFYDGFHWRKYGEKYIKNSSHQRSYYRCSYNTEHQCEARKHEQKISDNPPVYRTTYFGHHTCTVNHNQEAIFTTVVDDLEIAHMIQFGLDLDDHANKGNHSCSFPLVVKKEKDEETMDLDCQDSESSDQYSSELICDNPCWYDHYGLFDLLDFTANTSKTSENI